jgi:hypothetical protein
LNRSICYKREHSRTRLRLINTRMATVKLHPSKPATWNLHFVAIYIYKYIIIDIFIWFK